MSLILNREASAEKGYWSYMKSGFAATCLCLIVLCNIWVLTSAVKSGNPQVSRNDMLDAVAEEYSMNVATDFFKVQ